MILKYFPASSLILLLAACLFSGSFGNDRVIGTWISKEINDTMIFYEDGTWVSDYWTAGPFRGLWTKSDDSYWLYVNDDNSILGSGVVMIDGKNLIFERSSIEFVYVKA